jgi:hypothetical protein
MELFDSSVLEKYIYTYVIIPGIQVLAYVKEQLCPDTPIEPCDTIDVLDGKILFKNGKVVNIHDDSLINICKNTLVRNIIKHECILDEVKSISLDMITDKGEYVTKTYIIEDDPNIRI